MAEFSTSNMMGGLEDMEQQQGFKPMMEGMKPEGMKPEGMESKEGFPKPMSGGKKRKRKTKRKTAKKGGKRYKRKTAKKGGKKKRSGKKKH